MTADPNGWPGKPGVPANPEQDSEGHVIMLDGVIEVYRWEAARGLFLDRSNRWLAPFDLLPPDDAYLGRIHTPAEVAALVADAYQRGAEAMRESAIYSASLYGQGRQGLSASAAIQAAMRALPIPEDKP